MESFKPIDTFQTFTKEHVVHKKQTLDTGSEGISSTQVISGSTNDKFWRSLHRLYFMSGSPIISSSYGLTDSENLGYSFNDYCYTDTYNPQFKNKFHGYSNINLITIPQRYFGEQVKRGSFEILQDTTDIVGLASVPSKTVRIIDDGYGNLYSPNAHHSQSSATSISSSDNYVGNIWYEWGIVALTETGSWSGSVDYSDITSASNFQMSFRGTNTIFTTEYSVTIQPRDFNTTMNHSARGWRTITASRDRNDPRNYGLLSRLTGSDGSGNRIWNPYFTQIHLYNAHIPWIPHPDQINYPGRSIRSAPLIIANVPRPVQVRRDIPITFKIQVDK